MVLLLVGMVIGALIGMFIMALVHIGTPDDDEIEHQANEIEENN